MSKSKDHRKVLIQLDPDPQPSSFDRIVALDAGVDEVLAYGDVALDQVRSIVHGAIFTRGGKSLRNTAIFIGGSDVAVGESMLKRVTSSFLGPMSVSVMFDANGANTTAVAAVLAAACHLDLAAASALVLAGTGPVGQRAARLLAGQGAQVRLASRSRQRATSAAGKINDALGAEHVQPCTTTDDAALRAALEGIDLVIAAGAEGVQLLPADVLADAASVKVAIDLNAVPPLGIEGVGAADKAVDMGPAKVYGAIGVGGTKMKIHKAAIADLFAGNDRVLDADEIYALGRQLSD